MNAYRGEVFVFSVCRLISVERYFSSSRFLKTWLVVRNLKPEEKIMVECKLLNSMIWTE